MTPCGLPMLGSRCNEITFSDNNKAPHRQRREAIDAGTTGVRVLRSVLRRACLHASREAAQERRELCAGEIHPLDGQCRLSQFFGNAMAGIDSMADRMHPTPAVDPPPLHPVGGSKKIHGLRPHDG